ncbi:MAG TPA: hypothetical protein VJP80_07995 [Candidatus Saccharimonadales bacterium]|nr:hypothetical protein [Candidatus Saccharimonadales bacterium]
MKHSRDFAPYAPQHRTPNSDPGYARRAFNRARRLLGNPNVQKGMATGAAMLALMGVAAHSHTPERPASPASAAAHGYGSGIIEKPRPQDQARIDKALDLHIPTIKRAVDLHEHASLPRDRWQYDVVRIFTTPDPEAVSANGDKQNQKQVNGRTLHWTPEWINAQEEHWTSDGNYWENDAPMNNDPIGTSYALAVPNDMDPSIIDVYIPKFFSNPSLNNGKPRTVVMSVSRQADTKDDGGLWTTTASEGFGALSYSSTSGSWEYHALSPQQPTLDTTYEPPQGNDVFFSN